MGRRALRRIDPALDLSRWLKSYDNLRVPWDSAKLFGRRAPLEIDVGSGKGLFLLSASAVRAEVDYLGVELSGRYARHTAGRLAKGGITNALVIHGDATLLFRDLLPERSVAAVHVYFPDPWWKARHKKRRVMNDGFVRSVERALVPGGKLNFWTDVEEYFAATLDLLAQSTFLRGPLAVDPCPALADLDYRTHFERRMRLSGRPVFRAMFGKPLAGE